MHYVTKRISSKDKKDRQGKREKETPWMAWLWFSRMTEKIKRY